MIFINLLVIADFHSITYNQMQSILNLDNSIFDVICSLGDIDLLFLQALKNKFPSKPFIGVLGNHDYVGDLEYLNITDLHKKRIILNNIKFLGVEGCTPYKKNNELLHSQEEIQEFFKKAPMCDILLSHNSPFNFHERINDFAHKGFIGLYNYIYQYNPKLILHGHQHIWKRTVLSNKSILLGIYGACIINTSTFEEQIIIDLSKIN